MIFKRRKAPIYRTEHSILPPSITDITTHDRTKLENKIRESVNPIYIGNDIALCRILGRYKFYVDTTDIGFGGHILMDGFWEFWLTTFMAARLKPGMCALDLGANHGYYTLLFADIVGAEGRVAAIEPNPRICKLLRQSVAINGFSGRVSVLEQAATSVDGEQLTLWAPTGEPKNARIVGAPDGLPPGEVAMVQSGRMDTALASWPRLDFVKIDVEGAEEAAIGGLMPLLQRDRPEMVLEFSALRCAQPEALLAELRGIYGPPKIIGFDGEAHPLDTSDLLDRSRREDWLLYWSAA